MWRQEKQIWHLAMVLIGDKGAEARRSAQQRARAALEGDRPAEHLVWRDIADAVHELLRPVSRGDTVH